MTSIPGSRGVYVSDSLAFVYQQYSNSPDFFYGVRIVNVKDSSTPEVLGFFPTKVVNGSSTVYKNTNIVRVIENRLYIGTSGQPVFIIGDAADPGNMWEVGNLYFPDEILHRIQVQDSLAFAITIDTTQSKLYVLDIENFDTPQVLSETIIEGQARDLCVTPTGFIGYVAYEKDELDRGVLTYDLRDPAIPQYLDTYQTEGSPVGVWGVDTLFIVGGNTPLEQVVTAKTVQKNRIGKAVGNIDDEWQVTAGYAIVEKVEFTLGFGIRYQEYIEKTAADNNFTPIGESSFGWPLWSMRRSGKYLHAVSPWEGVYYITLRDLCEALFYPLDFVVDWSPRLPTGEKGTYTYVGLQGTTDWENFQQWGQNGLTTFNTGLMPKADEVAIEPDYLQLQLGLSYQFSSTGYYGAEKEETVIDPEYSATGGDMDANLGLYLATDLGQFIVTVKDLYSGLEDFATVDIYDETGIEDNSKIPKEFSLSQNYPNPFNPATQIQFGVKEKSNVALTLFNVKGQEIAELIDKEYTAGYYTVRFDLGSLSAGVYLYKIKMGNFEATRKMILVE